MGFCLSGALSSELLEAFSTCFLWIQCHQTRQKSEPVVIIKGPVSLLSVTALLVLPVIAGIVQGVSWGSDNSLTIFQWQWHVNHRPWVFASLSAAGLPPHVPLTALLAPHPAPSFVCPIISLEHQVSSSRHLRAFSAAQDCLKTSPLSHLGLCNWRSRSVDVTDRCFQWLTHLETFGILLALVHVVYFPVSSPFNSLLVWSV